MIISILRSIGAVVVSLIVALLLLIAIEGVSAILHPFPANFAGTREAMMEHVANYPAWVLALLGGAGWAATIFACSALAVRLGSARHPAPGYVSGSILFAAALFNISMLPYPVWFVVLDVIILPLGIYGGVRFASDAQANQALTGATSQR